MAQVETYYSFVDEDDTLPDQDSWYDSKDQAEDAALENAKYGSDTVELYEITVRKIGYTESVVTMVSV